MLVPRQLRNILKAKEGNSGATPQQRAFARERAPRELRVKTRRVVIQPGDESTWLTSSRVILGFPTGSAETLTGVEKYYWGTGR
jgi:hypothetical protein